MRLVLFCLWALILIIPAYARIINVPAEYTTIQAGIDASVNGDTVLVAPGEYNENLLIRNKNILLIGAEGPDTTHINGYLEILGASIDSTCILKGFKISMIVENPGANYHPLIHVQSGTPTIWGNIVENNINCCNYGGIWLDRSGGIIRGNIIKNNWSFFEAGGIAANPMDTLSDRLIIIEGNIISGNKAGWSVIDEGDAAGIALAASGTVRYNLIINNDASKIIYRAQGGGIRAYMYKTQIYNNNIIGNRARGGHGQGQGGGIRLIVPAWGRESFVKNNIIAFNPIGNGVDAQISDTADFEWDYNLVFGNDSLDYNGILPGTNDIQLDPQFVDTTNSDFHLLEHSPCIDAGDPSFPLDLDSTRCDIGAYYFDQSVGIDEDGAPSGPYQFALKQNYPNPFNGQTFISYYLVTEAAVSLHIYSITGHLILSLIDREIQEAGEHRYIWEGRDSKGQEVSTGIYFYELYVNDHKESKAMILIK